METGSVTIGDNVWSVDIASSSAELTTGLGNIASLAAGTGMLFNMGTDQVIHVTTVPMLFNLDIAYIKIVGESWVVSEIDRDVEPGVQLHSAEECRLFFEVNAGELVGVNVGDEVVISVLTPTQDTSGFDINTLMGPMIMIMMMGAIMPMMKGDDKPKSKYYASTVKSTKKHRYMTQNVLDEAFLQAIKRCNRTS